MLKERLIKQTVKTENYHGRLLVVCYLHYEAPEYVKQDFDMIMRPWYCGYAEVLPSDGINLDRDNAYWDYDDEIDAPGGLTFSGELMEFPQIKMLGFDTMHPQFDDLPIDADWVLERCRKMADAIARYSAGHGQNPF